VHYKCIFVVNFDDGNWRQAEASIVLFAGAVEVNAPAQGALRRFTQWPWVEHPTFQLEGAHFTTELMLPQVGCVRGWKVVCWCSE